MKLHAVFALRFAIEGDVLGGFECLLETIVILRMICFACFLIKIAIGSRLGDVDYNVIVNFREKTWAKQAFKFLPERYIFLG